MHAVHTTMVTVIAALSLTLAVGCSKKADKHHGSSTKGAKVQPNPDNKGPHIKITVDRKGYTPNKIEAKAGNAVLVFTRTADVACGKFVVVNGIAGKTELPLNKPVQVGVRLPKDGEVRFACGMDMMTGVIAIK